ncbi:Methionyl-tRNA formyltransferase [Exophiala xenobiotica]
MTRQLLKAPAHWRTRSFAPRWTPSTTIRLASTRESRGDPLRILFCGSDSFSATSLTALHKYSKSPQTDVASIDVVTRTDKRSGRSLKVIRSPPIKTVAQQLGLPVHQIDTFKEWSPPPYINLVVAVSFGLLIPLRILRLARYGGLNVHPSMLPDLPGAAPIQWTIIHGRQTTGVTVQTLHPYKFDQGVILDQTPPPGLPIPDPDHITTNDLITLLAPIGADMLVSAIRNKLYIPPYKGVPARANGTEIATAPKITPEMRIINFAKHSEPEILRRNRAIGPLLTFANRDGLTGGAILLKLSPDMRCVMESEIPEDMRHVTDAIAVGVPYAILPKNGLPIQSDQPLMVNVHASKGGISRIAIPHATVANMKRKPGAAAAARAGFFDEPTRIGEYDLYVPSQHLAVPEKSNDQQGKPPHDSA